MPIRKSFYSYFHNKAIRKIFESKTEISRIAAGRFVRRSLILAQHDYELKFNCMSIHIKPTY